MNYQKAINIIKGFEKCKLKAYKDSVGIWTIGYGSIGPDIKEGTIWTQEQAEEALQKYFEGMYEQIQRLVDYTLPEDEMCAICSLVYNIGISKFRDSTLLKLLNAKSKAEDIAKEFLKWNKGEVKGKLVEIKGLTNRRQVEHDLFLS